MSLHAQLSPEAEKILHAQRRNSSITSIVISVLTIVLVGLILGLFLLPSLVRESPPVVIYEAPDEPETLDQRKPVKTITQKPTPTSTSVAKVITTAASAPISVPVPEVDFTPPSLEFGDTLEFTQNWGGMNSFSNIPNTMKKRCSQAERMKRLSENGGDAKSEKAVVKALAWLKKTQNEDGSWGDQHQVAMTGFAILAYLGHCETPSSPQYGDTVSRGLTYIIDIGMKSDGKLWVSGGIPAVYEHGIATYALAEAYTFTKGTSMNIPNLDKVLKKAGERIMDGQAPCGGWAYNFNTRTHEGDNSVGFWQIQALKACKHTGIWPEAIFKKTISAALKWLEQVQGPNGAIGYRSSHTKSPGLTGGGALAFQMWDQGDSRAAKKAIEYIRQNAQFKWGAGSSNLYYHYYNAQAMMNAGGSDWKHYNKLVMDELVKNQNEDGSWKQKMGHGPINDHMATCLAAMTLEVYYRFLPGSSVK